MNLRKYIENLEVRKICYVCNAKNKGYMKQCRVCNSTRLRYTKAIKTKAK